MHPDLRTTLGPAGVVVGIGEKGAETYRTAVRLGAEEATLRRVPLRLVHGSRPAGEGADATASRMASRQQRGRRLVNGAARDLARTPLGRDLRIWTESSPRTGIDLLLAHSRSAIMLVLQRGDEWDLPAGRTARAVTAAAGCATLITRTGDRAGGEAGVLVVLGAEHDPAAAIALAFTEASLRRIAVSVLDGRGDRAAARTAIQHARTAHPGVPVHLVDLAPARSGEGRREASADAALVVVVRPADGEARGVVVHAIDGATCPVLVVAPTPTSG